MTKYETAVIMATLRAAYPQYYARQSVEDAEAALNLWAMQFAEEPAEDVAAAVSAYIACETKGFPPSIGQIKEKLDMLRAEANGGELTAQEAWALVQKACKHSYYNAEEEFNKLPDTARAVVGSAGTLHDWASMDLDTLCSVVASNFQRSYTARASHVAEMRRLPESVKNLIASPQFKRIGAWPGAQTGIGEGKA